MPLRAMGAVSADRAEQNAAARAVDRSAPRMLFRDCKLLISVQLRRSGRRFAPLGTDPAFCHWQWCFHNTGEDIRDGQKTRGGATAGDLARTLSRTDPVERGDSARVGRASLARGGGHRAQIFAGEWRSHAPSTLLRELPT